MATPILSPLCPASAPSSPPDRGRGQFGCHNHLKKGGVEAPVNNNSELLAIEVAHTTSFGDLAATVKTEAATPRLPLQIARRLSQLHELPPQLEGRFRGGPN